MDLIRFLIANPKFRTHLLPLPLPAIHPPFRYATLDHEMDDISRIWKAAKEHLNHQQDAHRKMIERRAQIKIDGESFKQRQAAASGRSKELGTTSSIAQSKEKERKK